MTIGSITQLSGGHAFPRPLPKIKVPPDDALAIIERHAGMTLLDYFAGQALASLIHPNIIVATMHGARGDERVTRENIALEAYSFAAAMLAERERRMKDGSER